MTRIVFALSSRARFQVLPMRDARCAMGSSTCMRMMCPALVNQYMEVTMRKAQSGLWFQVALCGSLLIGGTPEPGDVDGEELGEVSSALLGDALPGIAAADFAEAKAAFVTVQALEDGLGPLFNERACRNCHTQGAIGGADTQI